MNKKYKFIFFLLLFFIVFTIIGDSYIYFLDGNVFNSNFKIRTKIDSQEDRQEYIRDIERYSKQLNLKIYKITHEIKGKNSAKFTIYTLDDQKKFLKKRNFLKKDEMIFSSVISGKREIIFKPFADSINDDHSDYYVFGTKENAAKFRSLTIDKYGTGRPEENSYQNDAVFMVFTAWLAAILVIIISTFFEVNQRKKEVLLRYLNGSEKKVIILPLIITNAIITVVSFIGGMMLGGFITESFKFLTISLGGLVITLLVTSSIYLTLFRLPVKKILVRSNYTLGYRLLSFAVLAFISFTLIICLTFNFKNIYDAFLTLKQKEKWEMFADYDSIVFFFREETETTNFTTDEQHTIQFYNDNVDKYQMHLSFDFAINDAAASATYNTSGNRPFVYLNKYALSILEESGIDIGELGEDRYYILSEYSEAELRAEGLYDEITQLMNDPLNFDYGTVPFKPEVITVKKNYKLLLYDINVNNLADNYKKNPLIIVDTHSSFPHISVNHVFGSLINFGQATDFSNFINEIGYKNEVYFKNNVFDLYRDKQTEKTLILIINVILSALMMVLFTTVLAAILKLDFDARAIEVALNKVLGKNILQRYKSLFRLLINSLIIGLLVSSLGKLVFNNFSWLYVLFAGVIVLVNLIIVLMVFINKYEKNSIPKILKGGV